MVDTKDSKHSRVGDALTTLRRELYNLEQYAQLEQPSYSWEHRFSSYSSRIDETFNQLRETLRQYNMDGNMVIKHYLQKLEEYEGSLAEHREHKGDVYKIAYAMDKIAGKIQEYLQKREAKRLQAVGSTVAIITIMLISTLGLASFLYVQTEPTARVVSPTVANLPLGIAFLAILVIGIIAMPRLRH